MFGELTRMTIKLIDIGYISVLYIAIAVISAKATDRVLGKVDPMLEITKSKWRLTAEVIFVIWLFGILFYMIRNLVPLIPFPLDGIAGFSHARMKELTSSQVFSLLYLYFCNYFNDKLTFFYHGVF
jgi:hypothetical protein